MSGKNKEFQFEGNKYDISDLSDSAKKIINNLSLLNDSTNEKNNMIAILTKAKKAYIADLKNEILSNKSGFDFSD